MSDHPNQIDHPQAAPRDMLATADKPPVRPEDVPSDEKSVPERAEDEAAALGDFA